MENTKQVNVIATPNVQGNIGSCAVSSNEVRSANSLFTSGYHVTQVNSCTGKIITEYDYTTYGGLYGVILFAVFILCVCLASASSDNF